MKQIQNQFALVGVAAIEHSLANACFLGNLMHTDIFNASLGKQLPSHSQDSLVKRMVSAIGCAAVSVDYRLAPETSYPGPVEDGYAALKWLSTRADELGIDPNRIAVGGSSAGGGLATALALLTRDRKEVSLLFQLLLAPVLDITRESDVIVVWKLNRLGRARLSGSQHFFHLVLTFIEPAQAALSLPPIVYAHVSCRAQKASTPFPY